MNKRAMGFSPGKKSFGLYQLEIVLDGTKPPVRRRLLVRGDAGLGLLHAVFQVAMGWTNSHLHHFIIGRERYTDLTTIEEPNFGPFSDHDEAKTTLAEAVPREKTRFLYEYDFGDSWEHLVTVERIVWRDESFDGLAQCLEGSRACPPDDCGGIGGYADLLEIIKNPKHKEFKSMMEWLGRKFDPEAFDVGKINTYLQKLKWPRTTDPQLAKILMARDGVSK